jgi:hypothetical protein
VLAHDPGLLSFSSKVGPALDNTESDRANC